MLPEMSDNHQNVTTNTIVWSGILALAGGVVHEIAHGKQKSATRLIAGGLIGAFTGIVALFACAHFNIGFNATGAIVGMAGYCGSPLLDLMGLLLRRFIKHNIGEITKE